MTAVCYGCQDGGASIDGAGDTGLRVIAIFDTGSSDVIPTIYGCGNCIETDRRGCGRMHRELLAVLQGGIGG